MRALDRGEEFIVTRNGVPVGELRPIGRPHFVSTATVRAAMAGAPPIDAGQFFADIDAYVDQDPTPRAWREPES
jgi:antitoxin (DNA-binding transcriptional repressor) of toxin-antitoxin stability system